MIGKIQQGWIQVGRLARANQWQLLLLGTVASLFGIFAGGSEPTTNTSVATRPDNGASAMQLAQEQGKVVELSLNLNDDGGDENNDEIDFLRSNVGREILMRISLYQRGNFLSDAGFQKACQIRHKDKKIYTIFDKNFFGKFIAVNVNNFSIDSEKAPKPDDCQVLLVINSDKTIHSTIHDTVADANIVLSGLFRIRVEGMALTSEIFYLDQIDMAHIKVH